MRVRPISRPLAALALLALLASGACGADASADVQVTGPTVPTVTLTELSVIETLTTAAPPSTAPPSSTGTVPPGPEDVVIIGDSLTLSAEEEIAGELRLAGIDIVGFDAMENRRTARDLDDLPSGVTAAEQLAAEHEPDAWVIALGSNDVGGQVEPDDFRADVRALLGALPVGARVIWIDMWIEDRLEGSRELNAVLRQVAATRGNMTVVDWFQFGDDPGIVRDDGVHLTDAGQRAFAAQIAAALAPTAG
jgi:lysophospholipase L1-like esterase